MQCFGLLLSFESLIVMYSFCEFAELFMVITQIPQFHLLIYFSTLTLKGLDFQDMWVLHSEGTPCTL